ncbi:MAG: copper resistance D family protein [Actinomadura sp.]
MTSTSASETRPSSRETRLGALPGDRPWALRYTGGMLAAGLTALVFGLWLGDIWPPTYSRLVATDLFTAWGLPVSRLSVDLSAIGTIGMLTTCVLLPRDGGRLGDAARRCLRSATWLSLTWGVSMAALLVFTWSDVTAKPVGKLPYPELFDRTTALPEAVPYVFAAVLALVISAAVTTTETPRGAALLLMLSWYNLLPLTTQGHSDHSAVLAYAVSVHVMALSLWVGGLVGLLIHARTSRELLAVAVPRFSLLALACYVAVAGSGVVMAWVNLAKFAELWGSPYGLLVMCKLAALVGLGIFGWWHRQHTVRAVAGERGQRAFIQLAVAEILIMAAAVALGVALSRSSTPQTAEDALKGHAAEFQITPQKAGTKMPGHNVIALRNAPEGNSY